MRSYEITKKEFERRFPEVNTYGLEQYSPAYLDCGIVCIDTEWNGERYEIDGKIVTPLYNEADELECYEVD